MNDKFRLDKLISEAQKKGSVTANYPSRKSVSKKTRLSWGVWGDYSGDSSTLLRLELEEFLSQCVVDGYAVTDVRLVFLDTRDKEGFMEEAYRYLEKGQRHPYGVDWEQGNRDGFHILIIEATAVTMSVSMKTYPRRSHDEDSAIPITYPRLLD